MDLSQITEVVETNRPSDLKGLLDKGWVLLSTAEGKDEEGYPVFKYSLGFPGRPAIE